MVRKHIPRDYSAHKKSILRPYDEYVKLEIFSCDPEFTRYYLAEDNSLTKFSNAVKTSWKSWSCFISKNKRDDMVFDLKYNATEFGEYRIDIYYEKSNHIYSDVKYNTGKNLTGQVTIFNGSNTVHDKEYQFNGENNVLKKITVYEKFNTGVHNINLEIPVNCYFMGVIVQKLKVYTAQIEYGDNAKRLRGNIAISSATVSCTDMVKPTELKAEIGYDNALECFNSPSGFYIDYMDEVNFYAKDDDGVIRRVFGGYVSSILPDSNNQKLTLHCTDRLADGQNKYVLDEMKLEGGTTALNEDEYSDGMTKNFKSYAQALKYLCDIHESTLKSNISPNYLVDGEKFVKGLVLSYGRNKNIKSIPVSNGISTSADNFIMIRNKPSGEKVQTWTLYNASKVAKTPPKITDYKYLHITYGLGSPKTEIKSKVTEKVDNADTTAGAQKFSKCGVSADGKYIMAIGKPSAGKDSKKGWTKTVFKRKCPKCGSTQLYWGIFWAGNETSNWGLFTCTGNREGGSAEGHVFCKSCDADYSVQGWDHISGSKYHLEKVSSMVASSKSEAYKLKEGKISAVPKTGVSITPDNVFEAIAKKCKKYHYKLGGSSTYTAMKKSGKGDCWAFSELIFSELKSYGVSCKIVDYPTNLSDHHRSVLYKNAKGKWEDFPYRKYNLNKNLNNTSKSKSGHKIDEFKGTNIGNVKTKTTSTSQSQTTTITTTKNYDKSKPFQGYLKITYSTKQSFDAPKYSLYIKFTLGHTDGDSINTGLNLYWVNNTTKKATLKLDNNLSFIDVIKSKRGENANVYLQSIQMIAPKKKVSKKSSSSKDDSNWYTYDKSTIDESSCKMRLYQISFNNNLETESSELKSCGKSINSMLGDLVEDTGYLVDMTYGLHRIDDVINFRVDNSSNIAFTSSEGDNNNILSWDNISYNPLSSMYNSSMQVFKKDDELYHYVDTKNAKSILKYGEKCVLVTNNNKISSTEAYFNATMNEKYNSEQTYSYTITVPNFPFLRLGEYIKVVANAKKLNGVKRLKSFELEFKDSTMPRLRSKLGLNELSPSAQLSKNIRELKQNAKKESTYFTNSAIVDSDKEIYVWDQ